MPAVGRDGKAEYAAARLPGAFFFDVDGVKDVVSPLPHMLPPAAAFGAACDALGLSREDAVVLYDGAGLFSAARGWWMFRAMGHVGPVSVLDGGLPAWRAEGRPTEQGPPAVAAEVAAAACAAAQSGGASSAVPPRYVPAPVPALLLSREDVLRDVVTARVLPLLDARPAARFTGAVPEPRAGLRSGHMPGSRSLPFTALLQPDGRMLPPDALRGAIAAALQVEPATVSDRAAMPRLAASCGTGVTACVLALGAAVAGRDDVAVYDGSWTEWGGRNDTPVQTGDAA